ncbi:hypothetical protein Fmac_016486 [Flemingia macrophylla]|uniref:Glycosyltransferase n=1 Tax=Flemingia macrophylla TaxID=520843 RepID=A0ABD1MHK3_9FABA
MREGSREAHVLVIPFPAQGHMIPLLDLTRKLATNPTLTITLLTTAGNHHLLSPLLSSHPSIRPLLLPFPPPLPPPGVENVKDMPHLIRPIIFSLSHLHHPLLAWFRSHPNPPTFIISDMFLGWTQTLASHLGIRRLVFSPSAAFTFSTMHFLWNHYPKPSNGLLTFHTLPNSPTFPWCQVSPLFRTFAAGDPDTHNFRDWYLANFASWGLIVNSFADLERPYLDFLRKELGHDRVWAVGPLLPEDVKDRGGSSSVSVDDVVSWLDKMEDRKVVYVCFGSQATLSEDQKEAIASGLVKSGVNFVWSIKEYQNEEAFHGKGLLIRGWAPQLLILRHPAVGAFLTHCGWNSALEALAAGVPMLAWPMTADQFAGAALLVDDLKVAKRVCEGENTVPDSDLLARVLAESLSGDAVEITNRALKLKTAALDAVRDGGSSHRDLQCVVERLLSPLESD